MAELLFETYGVPSLAFGVDEVFGYAHNQKLGVCDCDGLLVNIGHQTIHVIPIVAGEPVLEAACRTPVGGFQVTSYLKRLLSLQYPYHVKLFGSLPDVVVPGMYSELTSCRVLIMEWIELLGSGLYHADPHPGNLLRTPDGMLAYLDFGMMSEMKENFRDGLIEASVHLINGFSLQLQRRGKYRKLLQVCFKKP